MNCGPPKTYAYILIPKTYECDFIWGGKVFVNVIKNLKMRKSSWIIWVDPKPMTNVLIRVRQRKI